MTTRTGNSRPRLVNGTGRGPAVHTRYRLRLKVDELGWVTPRSADERHGFIDQYAPGTVVEIDMGAGTALRGYEAVEIAVAVAQCGAVYLISAAACGQPPAIEHGTAYNADGVLDLMRQAIDHVASRNNPAC